MSLPRRRGRILRDVADHASATACSDSNSHQSILGLTCPSNTLISVGNHPLSELRALSMTPCKSSQLLNDLIVTAIAVDDSSVV